MNINDVKDYLLQLQEQLCSELEGFEKGKKFQQETWQYAQGGGGRSRVLEQGKVFEKAGVNFSHVQGNSLPASATASRPHLQGKSFQALGVSLVMHPLNPYVPTTHMNVRLFCTGENEKEPIWWFGGGFDLTPYYPFYEDVIHWHQTAKQACDEFDKNYYPRFKKCCDEYFYLKHRNETRGVGGLFFDDFNELDFEQSFAFMRSIGDAFIPAYLPIIEKRKEIEFQERQKQFQCYRRGRYVEFNLVFDRGTLFGLQSGGRTESILMSMPPQANWIYGWTPEPGSPEADLYDNYLQPRDWLKCGE